MNKLPESVCLYCADQNPPRDRSRGITHYTHGLLSHLRDSGSVKLKAVVSRSSFTIPEGIEAITLPFRTDSVAGRLLGDHLHPLMTPRNVAEVWHYPKGFLPMPIQAKAKRVGTIPDVMIQFDADRHPKSRSRAAWAYWLGMLRHSIRHFDAIITVSEFSKRAIEEFCQRHRIEPPPIFVTYQGVEVSSQPNELAKEDYVLHLASPLTYKGTRWLLTQWAALAKIDNHLPALKLIGRVDEAARVLLGKIDNVTLQPGLPRPELENEMRRARALLLPSEIEGFGIPAVEAYLLGTPVVFSKQTALEEIVGYGSPGGFERDLDSFAAAMATVLNMSPRDVSEKGAALGRKFNWNDCVERTLQAYGEVLS